MIKPFILLILALFTSMYLSSQDNDMENSMSNYEDFIITIVPIDINDIQDIETVDTLFFANAEILNFQNIIKAINRQ
jgi:hypothetical protein